MKLNGGDNRIIFITTVTNILTIKKYSIKYPHRSDSIYSPDLKLLSNPFHTYANIDNDPSGKM